MLNYDKDKLFVLDGTWLIRRQFFVCNKGVDKKTGLPDKNIIINSFLESLIRFINFCEDKYRIVIAFDKGTYRYRPKDTHLNYKSKREYDETFEVLWLASSEIIGILRNIGIIVIQVGGIEADDIGSYYSHVCKTNNILATSDKDWLLSTSKNTKVWLYSTKKHLFDEYSYSDIINGENIKSNFDLYLYKAIEGDKSDNIPKIKRLKNKDEIVANWSNKNVLKTITTDAVIAQIENNLKLVRLDHIYNDTEVIDEIIRQEGYVNFKGIKYLFKLVSDKKMSINVLNYINEYASQW